MLLLLSPAKTLDFVTPPHVPAHTQPLFAAQAEELIGLLKIRTPEQISTLMKLSMPLAQLNAARYQAWSKHPTAGQAKQAILAFNGDVYEGLDATSLNSAQLEWAQQHLCILSGLYGALRPLDLLQPYRLEMGTALPNRHGGNLYRFWGRQLADYLNQRLAADICPVVVNLASEEYFKSVDRTALRARVVNCVFEDYQGGRYKIIGFYAKKARGLMARHVIEQRLTHVNKLGGFAGAGYRFEAGASAQDRLVFRRRLDQPSRVRRIAPKTQDSKIFDTGTA